MFCAMSGRSTPPILYALIISTEQRSVLFLTVSDTNHPPLHPPNVYTNRAKTGIRKTGSATL